MNANIQILSQMPFFASLGEDTLQSISAYIHERRYLSSQVIIFEGEPCQEVYFVAKGLNRTSRLSAESRESGQVVMVDKRALVQEAMV